ncbi:methyltransferase type 11 [Xylariales sp. PMI_506]|nr:methyltransferase type 11 [Xylariales sp. PMI_506]
MEFHRESQASWETNAAFWDERVGADGNNYWTRLQKPALERMIPVKAGAVALELATGNGLGSRWLMERGCASILATDGSANMLKHAAGRVSEAEADKISFQQLDVTDAAAYEALLQNPKAASGFDIILINMAIHDIASIEPLANAIPKLLKPDGVFVATLLHPVSFTSRAARSIEVWDNPAKLDRAEMTRSLVLRQYLNVPPTQGIAVFGQPTPQIYFHRPLHELFGTFFKAGSVMDALEEPSFTEEDHVERIESHANFTQFPALLAFRLRRGRN